MPAAIRGDDMRVGIIGAGLAGVVAARELRAAGHEVVMVEKSRGLGGRLAARRVGGTVVDHGAPVIEGGDDDGALARLLEQLPADDRADLPEGTAYRSGATRLAKLAADGLEVVLATRIAALRPSGAGFELAGEQGNTHGTVDAVIVTAPAPQAADLLEASGADPARVAALRAVAYHPAVMILAGYAIPEPAGLDPFAVTPPFVRITNECAKSRPPVDGVVPVVARLTPEASAVLLDAADADILDRVLPALNAAVGAAAEPAWVQVKRWRYADPVAPADPSAVNPSGHRVRIAGDSIALGLAAVAESGRRAARDLIGLQ
ncbi:MAG: FAD-dependent oxidoreductase [Thermoleophilia bacterium]